MKRNRILYGMAVVAMVASAALIVFRSIDLTEESSSTMGAESGFGAEIFNGPKHTHIENRREASSKSEPAIRQHNSPPNRDAIIEFADGSEVSVTLKAFSPIMPKIIVQPGASLNEMYGPLVEAAHNGDVAAARVLGKALRSCQKAFETENDLENAIARLHNEGIRTFGDGSEPVQSVLGLDHSATEHLLRQRHEACKGISQQEKQTAADWSRLAAEQGDYLALQDWAGHLGKGEESFSLWHDAWEKGYTTAAQELVYYYRKGIGGQQMAGEPDHYSAYVYQVIAFKLDAAAYGSAGGSVSQDMDNALKYMGGLLGPIQLRNAEAEASRLLASIDDCCIVWQLLPE